MGKKMSPLSLVMDHWLINAMIIPTLKYIYDKLFKKKSIWYDFATLELVISYQFDYIS